MENLQRILEDYHGKGTCIAIIDEGLPQQSFSHQISSKKIKYYSIDSNQNIVEIALPNSIISTSNHSTICLLAVLDIAYESNVLLYSVSTNDGISIQNINKAIRHAIDQNADIISISLGINFADNDLFRVCELAYQKGIVINAAASHSPETLIYPADFAFVNKIDAKESSVTISRIDNHTYVLPLCLIERTGVSNNSASFEEVSELSGGSSIACAQFSAYCSVLLSYSPLNRLTDLLNSCFPPHFSHQKSAENHYEFRKSAIHLANYQFEFADYLCALNQSIIAFWDLDSEHFLDVHTREPIPDDNIDDFIVINASHYGFLHPLFPERLASKIRFFGFSGDDNFHFINTTTTLSGIAKISLPTIGIVSFGFDSGKLQTQIILSSQMKEYGFTVKGITNNIAGYAFGYDVLRYPQRIVMPDIVYEINHYLHNIETKECYDAILISIGGGMMPISKSIDNGFGALVNAYFAAVDFDYIIICINPAIAFPDIEKQLRIFTSSDEIRCALVVSDFAYDLSTRESPSGLDMFQADSSRVIEYAELAKTRFPQCPVFLLNDISDHSLFEDILDYLSE